MTLERDLTKIMKRTVGSEDDKNLGMIEADETR